MHSNLARGLRAYIRGSTASYGIPMQIVTSKRAVAFPPMATDLGTGRLAKGNPN